MVVTPVIAEQGKANNLNKPEVANHESNSGSNGNKPGLPTLKPEGSFKLESTASGKKLPPIKPKSASTSANQTCDPAGPWKNHGEYLSCVAKLKLGGKVVSESAKSDIGKKNHISTPSGDATESVTPSASPEATSSGTLTETISQGINSIQNSIKTLRAQFKALLDLLLPF